MGPLVGIFCKIMCAATLAITPVTGTLADGHSTGMIRILGAPIGRFVDNEDPNECLDVASEEELGWPLVLYGEPPNTRFAVHCGQGTPIQEWYPFGCGWPRSPIPHAKFYLLQGTFRWPGCHSATRRQRRRLLREVVRQDHPRMIFWYDGT